MSLQQPQHKTRQDIEYDLLLTAIKQPQAIAPATASKLTPVTPTPTAESVQAVYNPFSSSPNHPKLSVVLSAYSRISRAWSRQTL